MQLNVNACIFNYQKTEFGIYPVYLLPSIKRYSELRRLIYICLGICFLLWGQSEVCAKGIHNSYGDRGHCADSIMNQVIFYAPLYESVVESFQAKLYIKGQVNVKKKNFTVRYLPTMFRLKKGVREYMIETLSDLHFNAPNIYTQKVKAVMGTASDFWEADGRLLEYFHINIYSSTLLHDKLLSPLASNARKYYKYHIDSVMGKANNREFKIRFIPKYKSFQLVGGYMIISENVWSVREIRFSGRSEMFRFSNLLKMGEVGKPDEFLPVHYNMSGTFGLFGNKIDGSYVATLDYGDIKQSTSSVISRRNGKSKYDLTESYAIIADSSAYSRDTAYFDTLRPIPLTPHERYLYKSYNTASDTVSIGKKKSKAFWGGFGGALIDYYTLDLSKFGRIRCSPLINPFMFGYSARNGLSYRQKFRYNNLFAHDRLLSIVPSLGYNFKMKEFYWVVETDFLYVPRKQGTWHLEFGNGNRIYSSAMLDELKAIPDSIFDFDRVNLKYYKDLYLKLRHSWEIVNGLTLDVGLTLHRRTDEKKNNYINSHFGTSFDGSVFLPGSLTQLPLYDGSSLGDLYRSNNNSFAPGIRLTWTPGQYYYMDGERKVNLHSKYPTISLDWERGLSGVLPNSSKHERFEVEVQHDIPFGLLRSLYIRVGWGAFTKQDELYFVDFANFRPYNLPTDWNDDLGGVFQLLDRRWYNASSNYIRGHFTYESPFLLLHHINKYSQYVLNERFYLSTLIVPHLKPYVETGYGIGTHAFDFGVFASFANWKYKEIGVKFTFELFNR